jgi:hypothetical protein
MLTLPLSFFNLRANPNFVNAPRPPWAHSSPENPPQNIWLWEASASTLNLQVSRSFNGDPWQPSFDIAQRPTMAELQAQPDAALGENRPLHDQRDRLAKHWTLPRQKRKAHISRFVPLKLSTPYAVFTECLRPVF